MYYYFEPHLPWPSTVEYYIARCYQLLGWNISKPIRRVASARSFPYLYITYCAFPTRILHSYLDLSRQIATMAKSHRKSKAKKESKTDKLNRIGGEWRRIQEKLDETNSTIASLEA